MNNLEFTVQPEQINMRIDAFASACGGITRSLAQQLLQDGLVWVNDKQVLKSCKIQQGDKVCIHMPDARPVAIEAQDIFLEIVYEDDSLLVVNKPKGMVVHPAAGNPDGTLVNALLHHCAGNLSGINGELRPGIVHRIDKDTSGLLVVAKTNEAHLALSAQFAVHSITRVYHAVVYGKFTQDNGTVDAPIGRHPVNRKKMAIIDKNSRPATTFYEVLARYNGFSHVALRLKTGRTHQIRVHMASIGHPVAGDAVYGPKKVLTQLNGQCLHAKTLGFIHPNTAEYMEFDSELPVGFQDFLEILKKG